MYELDIITKQISPPHTQTQRFMTAREHPATELHSQPMPSLFWLQIPDVKLISVFLNYHTQHFIFRKSMFINACQWNNGANLFTQNLVVHRSWVPTKILSPNQNEGFSETGKIKQRICKFPSKQEEIKTIKGIIKKQGVSLLFQDVMKKQDMLKIGFRRRHRASD